MKQVKGNISDYSCRICKEAKEVMTNFSLLSLTNFSTRDIGGRERFPSGGVLLGGGLGVEKLVSLTQFAS